MSAPAAAATRPGWLFGPWIDLTLGCGLGYALLFTLQVTSQGLMAAWLPLTMLPLLSLVVGGSHYGATLLRVYERREDRHKYALFAVYLTIAIIAVFVTGLHWVAFGSWVVTVYLTWSPWHYSGQNYGVALTLLRRRGTSITPLAKRLFYASFLLSYGLVILTLHGIYSDSTYAPDSHHGTAYTFIPVGIPATLAHPLLWIVLAAYLGCLGGAGFLLARGGRLRDLGPPAVMVATQALWFVLPGLSRYLGLWGDGGPFSPANAPYTFMWVAVGHFVQYLWITSYYAVRSGTSRSHLRFLGKALLAGAALWTLPAMLFSPGLLGPIPVDMGLGLMAAACINLHHFVLDGAIWKLRDGRIARVLLKNEGPADVPQPIAPGRRAWRRQLMVAAGCIVLILALGIRFEQSAYRRAAERKDVTRMRSAAERLQRVGYDTPAYHNNFARMALARSNPVEAQAEIDRSLALRPTAAAWRLQAQLHESRRQYADALAAYEKALGLEPEDATALYRAGRACLRLSRPTCAHDYLGAAAKLAPNQRVIQRYLDESREALRLENEGTSRPGEHPSEARLGSGP